MIKLAVSGCQGRMGQRITALALEDKKFKLTTLLEHPNHPKASERVSNIKIAAVPDSLKESDVLIEFTSPAATLNHLKVCQKQKTPMHLQLAV